MDVTLAEFTRQVLISAAVMAGGLAVMAYVRFRYDVGHRLFRRFCVGYLACVALVAFLSVTSTVNETRCQRNPMEFCRYNDNIPFMAMVSMMFVIIAAWRSFFLHFNR